MDRDSLIHVTNLLCFVLTKQNTKGWSHVCDVTRIETSSWSWMKVVVHFFSYMMSLHTKQHKVDKTNQKHQLISLSGNEFRVYLGISFSSSSFSSFFHFKCRVKDTRPTTCQKSQFSYENLLLVLQYTRLWVWEN